MTNSKGIYKNRNRASTKNHAAVSQSYKTYITNHNGEKDDEGQYGSFNIGGNSIVQSYLVFIQVHCFSSLPVDQWRYSFPKVLLSFTWLGDADIKLLFPKVI